METRDMILICKALSDTNRLEIVQMLADGEKCGCKSLDKFDIRQPSLSHHMKILCDADIVQGRKDGKWGHYSINPEGAERSKKLLEQQLSLVPLDEQNGSCCR